MCYLSKFEFNALKILYKRYIMKKSNWNSIPLIVIFLFVSYSLSVFSADQKIGTCYTWDWRTDYVVDDSYVDTVGITSFRFGGKWGWMDDFVDSYGYDSLADYIASKMPSYNTVTNIFMIKFWHHEYMDRTGNWDSLDVFPVDPAYERDFKSFCYNLADVLDDEGIEHFVLHNEPDLGWTQANKGKNWMSTPEKFAEQCYMCANEIRSANPNAYIIFGSFAGTDTSYFVRTSVDSMINSGTVPLKIDCVDFHCYGESMPESTASEIGHKLWVFCDSLRGLDWSMLETRGPRYYFPVDSAVRGGNASVSIRDSLISGMENDDWQQSFVRDSLYEWTRYIDPDFVMINSNWGDLEDEKVEEFSNRFVTWLDDGASFIHWFAAYRHHIVPLPLWPGPDEADEEGPSDSTDYSAIVDQIVKHAEILPLNILGLGDTSTGLSDTIKGLAEELGREYIGEYRGYQSPEKSLVLYPNYPNAFNSNTQIEFYIREKGHIIVDIYNLMGQRVERLVDKTMDVGNHSIIWNASTVPAGVYFCRLRNHNESVIRKMCLLK
ncbi:MAG: T9SS type A sorting domain-containing protein [candidate division Zixibacteria bacterium]|nr:T9SS type A sorting domain-containing protein [candidate division Zixibacteria bacterium]